MTLELPGSSDGGRPYTAERGLRDEETAQLSDADAIAPEQLDRIIEVVVDEVLQVTPAHE